MDRPRKRPEPVRALPCPFCGNFPIIRRGGPGGIVWFIDCDRDDIHEVRVTGETRNAAIQVWNRRKINE